MLQRSIDGTARGRMRSGPSRVTSARAAVRSIPGPGSGDSSVGREEPGVATRRSRTEPGAVDERDGRAALVQRQRAGQADEAAADDDDGLRRHAATVTAGRPTREPVARSATWLNGPPSC